MTTEAMAETGNVAEDESARMTVARGVVETVLSAVDEPVSEEEQVRLVEKGDSQVFKDIESNLQKDINDISDQLEGFGGGEGTVVQEEQEEEEMEVPPVAGDHVEKVDKMETMEQGLSAATETVDDNAASEQQQNRKNQQSNKILHSATSSALRSTKRVAMESSALKFRNIDFVVGKSPNQKHILTNINGKIKDGHVLAIMGPSGAGKTTLISALTLDAHYGMPYGKVTLNGVPMTGSIFKKHCFVVKQQDKHWPYLTAREALQYAAGLYDIATAENIPIVVDEMIGKMGLNVCADTMCARLSGGQKRRLSIAVALLKRPTVLYLDEPTSGLDAASSSNIMAEITRVAKEERLIIICTIHQPSTKVYNNFDQVMLLSSGRVAFSGNVDEAVSYFGSIGHALPPATNPAEHFLDLVNSDFSGDQEVGLILDEWERQSGGGNRGLGQSSHHDSTHKDGTHENDANDGDDDDDDPQGIGAFRGTPVSMQIRIMFRRHANLIMRDPILYLGRCFIFLFINVFFAFVYWRTRKNDFDQIFSKMWIQIWFVAVPSNMGVVAVYALNDEFKSIHRETQNGMSSPGAYVTAKSILVLPVLFLFGLFCLVIPSFVIQDAPWSAFVEVLLIYVATMAVFESVAETLSVAFDDPILGMLQFMNFWFGSFLFGGFLIPEADLYWPLKLFFYIMPFSYYVRSMMYITVTEGDWDQSKGLNSTAVLNQMNVVYPVIEDKDQVWQDVGILLCIAVFYKLLYILLVMSKSAKVTPFNKN